MLLKVFYNELDPTDCQEYQYDCLLAEWMRIREQHPNARLYHGPVSQQTDVTPKTKAEALALLEADGDYAILCHAYGFDPITWAIVGVVLSVGAAVYTYMHMPKLGTMDQVGGGSANNSLANRQNRHRAGQRVPDIYGRVKSIPDLIAPVYRYYRDNLQVEECLLCIGTGHFDITNICESETPIDTISGASISIYPPDMWLTDPAPQVKIGEQFNELPLVTKQVAAVDGKQKLMPPNSNVVSYHDCNFASNKVTVAGSVVQLTDNQLFWQPALNRFDVKQISKYADFTQYFVDGEKVVISGAKTADINLDGTYTIASVTSNDITLVNPKAVNSDWDKIASLTTDQIAAIRALNITFTGSAENWAGWYFAGSSESTGFLVNFLAQNGLFDGGTAKQVGVEVQWQPVVNGQPVGDIQTTGITMTGKANNRDKIGQTLRQSLGFTGEYRFRVRRINNNGTGANLVDDVIVESAYSCYTTTKSSYPLDTVVRLRRLAIGSGTNASELNMIVTRKLYSYRGGVRSASRQPVTLFADSLVAMALDDYIGRMDISDLDLASIYATEASIIDYFGTALAAEFNYTFDDAKASYQEMAMGLAEAVFCTARRENGLHFLEFERQTPNSVVLFNHRNMKPESLTVTEAFGIDGDNDGIEFKWRDRNDNYAESIIKLPDEYRSNYKTIESIGITSRQQAHFLAHRSWNKLKYNRRMLEFTGYGEADIVTRNDRISVTDTTVPILAAGQVYAQDGLTVELDYPVTLQQGTDYVIYLQLPAGMVDVIPVTGGQHTVTVQLTRPPSMPLVVNGVAPATYEILPVTQAPANAYLLHEKRPVGTFESTITAMQYDDRYYQNDADVKSGLI